MPKASKSQNNPAQQVTRGEDYYRVLQRHTLLRLVLLYLAPFVLLVAFFQYQYHHLLVESRLLHLRSIAENQARTLDLFLRERLVNLSNLIDDPKLPIPPSNEQMNRYLESLRNTSDAFVDLGFFNSEGILLSYAGPYPALESLNYSAEEWFKRLKTQEENYIITDIYLGFRGEPHFTIAVSRWIDGRYVVIRAVISPEKLHEHIRGTEASHDVNISVVNQAGLYQVTHTGFGSVMEQSQFRPPREPWLGTQKVVIEGTRVTYAHAWLRAAPWVLIVQDVNGASGKGFFTSIQGSILMYTGIFFVLEFIVIFHRSRTVVRHQREADQTEAELSGQLVQASKLASVGELAAGIAHEINNPLAIIAEEVGLVKDLTDPEFSQGLTREELLPHLQIVHDAAFRCRDITRKLLGFVRQTDVKLGRHNIQEIVDTVVDGFLGREFELSNIKVIKDYSPDMPEIFTDRNQLEQVFLNLVKNAFDAMEGEGTLTLHISHTIDKITVSVSDTGCGMSPEVLEKIFMPFYSTKEVGKGTGLGLSVSFSIIKNLGGQIYVDSKPGKGSMFAVELPIVSS